MGINDRSVTAFAVGGSRVGCVAWNKTREGPQVRSGGKEIRYLLPDYE
jgi:hypothetical protein